MKKIFITIPWFLPAFRAGGPIQSVANLVKEFHEDIHYYIFCGDTDLNGGSLENITTGEWVAFNEYTEVWYAGHEKISEQLVKQVETIHPDIMYIIGIYSWHYNMVPLLFCKVPKKILSVRGMLHPGALSQKKWKKKIFLTAFKLLEYQHKVIFHATDEEEKQFIEGHFGNAANIQVAGNFPGRIGALPVASKVAGELQLVSIALISPMKNILPVLEALAMLENTIHYHLYGPVKDAAYWESCLEKINALPANVRVHYHREIEPGKVKEVLAKHHVFILPSKSENFGHAIYEALSAGRPVITSNNTPWNKLQDSQAGLNVEPGNTKKLAEAIRFFAGMNQENLVQWSDGAIQYAAKAFDLEKTRGQYRELFDTLPG